MTAVARVQLDHLITAVDTFRVLIGSSTASGQWRRSAQEHLLHALEQYRRTEQGEIIDRQRALLRRALERLGDDDPLAAEIREVLGDLPPPM